MGLIAVIDQPEVVEKILRHLDLWCGPALFAPARPPPGTSPSLLSEPDPDYLAGSNPEPDYENVITD